MRYIRITNLRSSRQTNPLVRVLGLIVGIILFIGAVVLGGLVLAALIGFLLIAGLVIYARIWWLMRKTGRQRQTADDSIEAEYQVIDTSVPDDDRH